MSVVCGLIVVLHLVFLLCGMKFNVSAVSVEFDLENLVHVSRGKRLH
jgi:hypothetical protein